MDGWHALLFFTHVRGVSSAPRMGWTRGSLGNSSSLEAVAEVASALLDTCHDQACVSFGKRLEIHFVGHVLRLASTLRVYKKERRARFFLSPSSSPLQEVCSPQLTTDGSRRKKIRRRWRRHVRSISMQGRTTDTKKQSRREREREAVRRQHRDNVSEYVHNQRIQDARTIGFANSCMCEISYD